MKNLKEVLQKLEDADMHVHEIDHEAGYRGFNVPIAILVNSSHFIMHGADIVHVGNLKSTECFALTL